MFVQVPKMTLKRAILSIWLGLFLVFSASVHLSFAQSKIVNQALEPTFVVKNFEVKVFGNNIFAMRDSALNKAKDEGFERLLKKITPAKTWGAHAQLLSRANMDDLFYKAVIDSEEITSYYKASIHLFYKEKSVRSLLAKYGIPYTQSTGGKVLILPIYEYGQDLVFWGGSNPVRDAVARTKASSNFFEILLPQGTKSEASSLSARLAVLGAGDLITAIGKSYNTDAVVVVHAKLSSRYDGFYLDVSANWYEEDTLVEPVIYSVPIDGLVLFDGYPDEEKLADYLDAAMLDVFSRIGGHKRDENLIEVDKPGRIFLRFKPQDPSDLEKLQNKIKSLSTVKDFKLRVLNVKDSVFQVDFYGEKSDFKESLKEEMLSIEETSMPMVWKVSFQNDPFLGPVDYSIEESEE